MTDMRIVESGLIPVYEGAGQERLVNARELHESLGSATRFNDWIQRRLDSYGFREGTDFYSELSKTPSAGRPTVEYWLRLNVAKELAMVESNARGQQIRRYLIEVEERYRAGIMPAEQMLTDPDFLVALATRYRDERNARLVAEARVVELAPKAEFHDRVAMADDGQTVADVAKVLGTGEIRLFRWLRDRHILMDRPRNIPYQEYIDRGYFRVVQRVWKDRQGEEHPSTQTLVTGRGLIWIQRQWDEDQGRPDHPPLRVV